MTQPPDPPPSIATMRTIGFVWVGVGVLAILGGAIATVAAVAVFGVLAVLLGAGLVGIQQVRARSAIRASRTLTNAPAPPGDPPSAAPPGPPPDPAEWYDRRANGGRGGGPDPRDDGPEAAVGSPSGDGDEHGEEHGDGDEQGDAESELSISEQDEDDEDRRD